MLWRVRQLECAGRRWKKFQPTSSSDMALDTVQANGRRVEVVVDGLPLFRGAQLAIDTTLVSPLQGDGQPHKVCADVDGAASTRPGDTRSVPTPSCANATVSSWLLKLGADGRGDFLKKLAMAKARGVPRVLQVRARQAWQMLRSSVQQRSCGCGW